MRCNDIERFFFILTLLHQIGEEKKRNKQTNIPHFNYLSRKERVKQTLYYLRL